MHQQGNHINSSRQMTIGSTIIQKKLCDAAKSVLRGKFLRMQAFLKQEDSNKQPKSPPKRNRKRRTNKI